MYNIKYVSTRNNSIIKSCEEAIIQGISENGGLFVPTQIPKLDKSFNELIKLNYKEIALYVFKKFYTSFSNKELKNCVDKAYDNKFDTPIIAPTVKKSNLYFLELFHGPTLAFKDMALSILPHLIKTSCNKMNINEEIVILTATSGDTGKAALEGFSDVDNTKIIVFYPEKGVSKIQKQQMITQKGNNTYVIGIDGNFDDAQNSVKEIFTSKKYKKILYKHNYMFSSANSINIGRLIPQIVYYIYSYINLLKDKEIVENEMINVVVPTGNFGNILAAYYAKQMGLPINKLICASNENNVLYDFINTGVYDKRREFKTTISPSMDILISSNLERLLYTLSNNDPKTINTLMTSLKSSGHYKVNNNMKKKLQDNFYAGYATEKQTYETINTIFKNANYLIDPHTAVAYSVYKDYKKETNDTTKTIIASTASPYKFTKTVMKSLNKKYSKCNDFELINTMSKLSNTKIPNAILDIDKKSILHDTTCKKDEIKLTISKILKI